VGACSPQGKGQFCGGIDAAWCWHYYWPVVVAAALLESPQVLIAEEEKIIIEETKGDQTIVEEKYVCDNLY